MIVLRIWDNFWWWFLHATGADNPSGPEYGFWSGWGSVFIQPTIFIGAVLFYWHHTCHVGRCLLPARHEYEIDGVKYHLCRRHHPKVETKLTAEKVQEHHDNQGH